MASTAGFLRQSTLTDASLQWLTRKRIKHYALLLGCVMWLAYLVDLSHPGMRDFFGHLKGADFLHFYTLGSLALQHQTDGLYDLSKQASESVRLIPESQGDVFVPIYGPQVALFFAPFAKLPYAYAVALWAVISALIYVICCVATWQECEMLRSEKMPVVLLAFAFPAFFNLISFGQNSIVALACFTAIFFLLRSGKLFFAGCVCGMLFYKPQLGIAIGIVFLLCRMWPFVAGAVLSIAAQMALAALYFGPRVLSLYVQQLGHIPQVSSILEPKIWLFQSLRPFWRILLGDNIAAQSLYWLSAGAVLTYLFSYWKSELPFGLRYSALLIGTVLIAPHIAIYDLVILASALLLLTDWSLRNRDQSGARTLAALIACAYCAPLFVWTARLAHLPLTVPILAAMLWMIHREPTSSRVAAEARVSGIRSTGVATVSPDQDTDAAVSVE